MSWPIWVWMALYFTVTLIFEVGFILLVMKTRFRSRDSSPPEDQLSPTTDRRAVMAVKWDPSERSSDKSTDKSNHEKRTKHPA